MTIHETLRTLQQYELHTEWLETTQHFTTEEILGGLLYQNVGDKRVCSSQIVLYENGVTVGARAQQPEQRQRLNKFSASINKIIKLAWHPLSKHTLYSNQYPIQKLLYF